MTAQLDANAAVLRDRGYPKPIVVTEASYTSDAAHQSVPGYSDGEEAQARYVVDAFEAMLGHGVEVAFWASLADSSGSGPYARSGLLRQDGTAKPAFAAYRRIAGRPSLGALSSAYGGAAGLAIGLTIANPGPPTAAVAGVEARCGLAPIQSLPALFADVVVPGALPLTMIQFVTASPPSLPSGTYLLVLALTVPGAVSDGRIGPGECARRRRGALRRPLTGQARISTIDSGRSPDRRTARPRRSGPRRGRGPGASRATRWLPGPPPGSPGPAGARAARRRPSVRRSSSR